MVHLKREHSAEIGRRRDSAPYTKATHCNGIPFKTLTDVGASVDPSLLSCPPAAVMDSFRTRSGISPNSARPSPLSLRFDVVTDASSGCFDDSSRVGLIFTRISQVTWSRERLWDRWFAKRAKQHDRRLCLHLHHVLTFP